MCARHLAPKWQRERGERTGTGRLASRDCASERIETALSRCATQVALSRQAARRFSNAVSSTRPPCHAGPRTLWARRAVNDVLRPVDRGVLKRLSSCLSQTDAEQRGLSFDWGEVGAVRTRSELRTCWREPAVLCRAQMSAALRCSRPIAANRPRWSASAAGMRSSIRTEGFAARQCDAIDHTADVPRIRRLQ